MNGLSDFGSCINRLNIIILSESSRKETKFFEYNGFRGTRELILELELILILELELILELILELELLCTGQKVVAWRRNPAFSRTGRLHNCKKKPGFCTQNPDLKISPLIQFGFPPS